MQGDEEDRTLAAVTEVMARLAAGDMAAMTTLQDRWGGPDQGHAAADRQGPQRPPAA